jgi:N-acetylmuramoyl-L-alanine amidase
VKREPLYVTSRVAMPSVLVELGFLTNPNEEDFLNSEQGKGYMASAIYRALKDYIHEQEGVIEDVKDIQQIIESDSTDSISTVEPQEDEIPEVTTFLSVQIMSSSIVLDQSKAPLSELSNCFYLQNTNLYKYFSGKYTNLEEVKIHQQKLVSQGFTDCFVVGVHNNAKVPISKALELLK